MAKKTPSARSSRKKQSLIDQVFGTKYMESPKVAWWHLWSRVLVDHHNQKTSRTLPERDHNFYSNDRASMSGKSKVTVILSIDGYGNSVPVNFRSMIRARVPVGVKVSFISNASPTTIDWNSHEMKNRLRNYKRLSDEVSGRTDDVFEYGDNLDSMDRDSWLKFSIKFLVDSSRRRNSQMFDFYSHIIISGDRGEDFDKAVQSVQEICARNEVLVNRINRNLGEFYRGFSPFSLEPSHKIQNSVGKNVLPDEVISRFVAYDQGKIGSKGIYLGTDIMSGYSIIKQFKKDDVDAENILILAETGWGKSFFVKMILLQLLAWDRVKGTIMDIEGFEYLPMAQFISGHDDVVILNMAEGKGSYFDPVAIVRSGDAALDVDNNVFGLSKSYTLAFFNTLVGKGILDSRQWASVIINDAVAKTYAEAGVRSDDYSTWHLADNLTLHSVYAKIAQMHSEAHSSNSNQEYSNDFDLVRASLRRYFESPENGGSLSDTFQNKVSLREVADAKLVVCSFGMASRSTTTVDTTQMALTQLSAANISHIRSLFCKRSGHFNVKVWEELQRWASFPGSEEILNVATTGGRKMGDINFLISNDPRMFLGVGAKLGVFSNVTSFFVGAISDAIVRGDIAAALSVPELLPDLNRLSSEAGDVETFNQDNTGRDVIRTESPYRRAFLQQLDKSVVTMGKAFLPPFIAESDLFRTGSSAETDSEDLTNTQGTSLEDLLSIDFAPVTTLPKASTNAPIFEGIEEDNIDLSSGFLVDPEPRRYAESSFFSDSEDEFLINLDDED